MCVVHTYVIHTCSIQCTTLVVVVLRIEWKKSGCSAAGFVVGKSREKKREPPHSNFYVFSTTINCFAFKPTHIVALIEGTPRHRKYVHFQDFPLFLFANESFTYLKYWLISIDYKFKSDFNFLLFLRPLNLRQEGLSSWKVAKVCHHFRKWFKNLSAGELLQQFM